MQDTFPLTMKSLYALFVCFIISGVYAQLPPKCGGNKQLCSTTCVNVNNNAQNCGSCGNICAHTPHGSTKCVSGQCQTTCGKAFSQCGSACVNLNNNVSNCGSCGSICAPPSSNGAASCGGGTCGIACSKGYSQCGNTCVNFKTDPKNCNTCGNVCTTSDPNATPTCANGKCAKTCNPGFISCNGICVNEMTDAKNCGSCGKTCKANNPNGAVSCNSGVCSECDAPNQFCGSTCTNVQNDPNNCGSCGTVCKTTDPNGLPTCTNGVCGKVCDTSYPNSCDSCVNEQMDTNNCGSCGTVCATYDPYAVPSCTSGSCQYTCSNSYTQCSTDPTYSYCVDTTSDIDNCGGCGSQCNFGIANGYVSGCSAGVCQYQCNSGYTQCTTNGQTSCTNFIVDNNNCGSCGNVCGSGTICLNNACVAANCPVPSSSYQAGYDSSASCNVSPIDNVNDCCALCASITNMDAFFNTYDNGSPCGGTGPCTEFFYANSYCYLASNPSCSASSFNGDDTYTGACLN